jgi:hypothetical protein
VQVPRCCWRRAKPDRRHKQIVWSIAKPASINLRKWFLFPAGSIKPWFHNEGNLPLCSLYLPLGVPNWVASTANQAFFWRRCWGLKKNNLPRQLGAIKDFFSAVAGEKEDFCKGSLSLPIFYFVIVFLIYFTLFLLASFYQKYKKISSYFKLLLCLV